MFDLTKAERIYIAVGYSDLRHGIDGFAAIIQNTFHMNPQTRNLYIFCGRSASGKAAHYTRNQWPWLIAYLEDGRLEISNNRAERSIKPFVMSRKNFLFANTPNGAKASSIYFNLIETAKENGLDPYRYLVWVLTNAPWQDMNDPTQVDMFLPMNAPEECRAAGRISSQD